MAINFFLGNGWLVVLPSGGHQGVALENLGWEWGKHVRVPSVVWMNSQVLVEELKESEKQ